MKMKIYFAPMEGMTDGILRSVHQKMFGGVDVYCLPFHKLTQTMSLLTREKRDIDPEENKGLNVLPQALTRDPEQYSCADLNLGCPSATVTKRGRGSGMLRDPEFLESFLDSVFSKTLPTGLSVKTRIGYEQPEEWGRILDILAKYPFEHVTIHVRTMKADDGGRVSFAGPLSGNGGCDDRPRLAGQSGPGPATAGRGGSKQR